MHFILQIKAKQYLENVLHNSFAPKYIYETKKKEKNLKITQQKLEKYSASMIRSD